MALKPNRALTKAIQSRVARIAVAPSSVRGRTAGATQTARNFFSALSLQQLGATDAENFAAELDRHTARLAAKLPSAAWQWGLARKLLNIFLRDCAYNAYLRSKFGLGRMERHLELPLDSITARTLRFAVGRNQLRPWPGLTGLSKQLNADYQRAATKIARSRRMRRVHLDVFWWATSRDKNSG